MSWLDHDRISTTEGFKLYVEQMIHTVQSLDIPVTIEEKPKDKILGRLYPDTAGAVAFPALEGILDIAKGTGNKPPSISAAS